LLSGVNSLANLATDIASMANMVAQLKRSEREKHMMKIQYEEKLAQQQQKIRETEMERDRVLASLGKTHLSVTQLTVVYHRYTYYVCICMFSLVLE